MVDSLWGEEFNTPEPIKTKSIINKIKKAETKEVKVEKVIKSKTVSIEDKIAFIKEKVYSKLYSFMKDTIVIDNKEALISYIDKAILNGEIAVDTETNNSLDPTTCKLMGVCIYTSSLGNAYIPINHVDYKTKERLDWQLTEEDIKEQLSRLSDTKIIMHNGKFDYQVLKCTCDIVLSIYWDTMIGAKVLDENEPSAKLKVQYVDKIDSTLQKYSIDELFTGVEYAILDPKLFAIYAATDAYMTFQLYKYQYPILTAPENAGVYNLFTKIEMPLVPVLAEMELTGMEVDQEYAQLLSKKYHKQLDDIDAEIAKELSAIQPQIDAWRATPEANKPTLGRNGNEGKSKSEQLENPINLASPTQLAILLYDVLKAPLVNKKSPRSTGEEELKEILKKLNLALLPLIIKRKEQVKLLTTYVDTIPELAKRWPDGRIRTHFNQYGAATGRLSSSDPINFQNIPSGNKEIRMLFKAGNGCRIVGADYSAQEPRLTAFYSDDENMINAYKEKKDLYSVIASMSFDRSYEDCLEFYPEGTKIHYEGKDVVCGYKTHINKEGKKYRTMAKSILLGVLYGRGAASVGEQIGKSREEAQQIIDKFFNAFPKVKQWINGSIQSAHTKGYVEDIAGRRRRLPDILLSKYEIVDENNVIQNPLLYVNQSLRYTGKVERYLSQLNKARSKAEVDLIKKQASMDHLTVKDNGGFIAQAERQAVNSRVQGGAASLTKYALITIHNDKRMKDIGAKLINAVHDEILMEVPSQYAEQAEKLLAEDMVNSAEEFITTLPMGCDTYNTPCWYLDEFFVLVQSEFKKLLESGLSDIEAFDKVCSIRTESTRDQLYEIVSPFMHTVPENIKIIQSL